MSSTKLCRETFLLWTLALRSSFAVITGSLFFNGSLGEQTEHSSLTGAIPWKTKPGN